MKPSRYQNPGLLTVLRDWLARAIAPDNGDSKTERWDVVTVEPITELNHTAFEVIGQNEPLGKNGETFRETVDTVLLNNSNLNPTEHLCLAGGVEFEYYWNPEAASINIYH